MNFGRTVNCSRRRLSHNSFGGSDLRCTQPNLQDSFRVRTVMDGSTTLQARISFTAAEKQPADEDERSE